MPTQAIPILISFVALGVSIGGFLSARQAAWSIRYYERWFQLARLVLDNSKTLLPLWCSASQYAQLFVDKSPIDREPTGHELVFAEMYVDFVLEVNRRGTITAFLTGRFPGKVPLTNPRMLYLWETHIRSIYSEREQRVIDDAIARHD